MIRNMLKVAMLSKWHVHAGGYANILRSLKNVKITCVWDELPSRGKEWAKELEADFEDNLDILLKRSDVDGVVVCAPTNMHANIMVSAAQAGKHIFTEKAMALTVKDCDKIADAVKKSGVKFCISFPDRTTPEHLYVKKVIDENLIGNVTLLRARNGHDGALNNWLPDYWYDEKATGGGAMMDLGCHPMYLASWILGKPKRIMSMFNYFTNKIVEDNAVCTIEFQNKALAIVETSFVTYKTLPMLEVYGTEGSIIINGNDVKLISKKMDPAFSGWVNPSSLPKALPAPIVQWVDGILKGEHIYFGTEDGTKLTELLENAYISHKEKREIEIQQ